MRTLNCKRTGTMIALYLAGDLVAARERQVAAHLAACVDCRRLAEEFSESSSLLKQACPPPAFGADFYSGIRHNVLAEIARDRKPARPSLFRRRWLYATAFAALVIAFAVIFQHFGRTRRAAAPSLALGPQVPATIASASPQLPKSPSPVIQQSAVVQPRKRRELPAAERRSGQFDRAPVPDGLVATQAALDQRKQVSETVTNAIAVVTRAASQSGGSTSSPAGPASAAQVPRIEIQTADPNIRIIWLAPGAPGQSEETNHDQDQYENGDRE